MLTIAVAMSACRTNEANYRAAYEIAKEKRVETGDSTTTAALRGSMEPKSMAVDGVTLPVLTLPVSVVKADSDNAAELKRYCVIVGTFKQIFNARSMSERLIGQGYDGAFVVKDRNQDHYVVAGATNDATEAHLLIERLKSDQSVVLRSPFPYALRPAQLVR